MRVLSIFCHPVEDSYNAALHRAAKAALERAGHAVDDCDQERIDYHDPAVNRAAVRSYVERLLAAEALVLCFPVWNFGLPALLKGFFDRVFLPGVSFDLRADGRVEPRLQHIRKIAAIATYGRTRPAAWYMGDPPRRFCTRGLRRLIRPGGRAVYLAHYRMNVSTEATRARFLAKVERAMAQF
jgi:NAD(P)H dehydrogenase (quinone)